MKFKFWGRITEDSALTLFVVLFAVLIFPISGARGISVSVSPSSSTLDAGQTQQFSAAVMGTSNTAVTWSLNSPLGSISSTGLYTAPASISSTQSVTVIAKSVADPTKTGTVNVTLRSSISVSITPGTASLTTSQTQQFSAAVMGTSNTAVTWSLSSLLGSISSTGLYTAPAIISGTQSVTVMARSVADPTKTGTVNVTLRSPISVSITPGTASLTASQTQQFSATVTGSSKASVTWSATPVGTISKNGLYTAPSSIANVQTVTISATSSADSTKTATAAVTLNPSVKITVTPNSIQVGPGKQAQFLATVAGTKNSGVMWSLKPGIGSIASDGVYTAPVSLSSQQTVTVIATSVADTTQAASADVMLTVQTPPPSTSDDEFVGPFPSWTNLKAAYGAVGDGVTDDTAAINRALVEVGTAGHSHVLYVNCGTYRVTSLTVPPHEGISVLGEDPGCVKFQLAAGSVGPLLRVNGVDYSRFSRITFDGGGNTSAVLVEQSGSAGGFFDTGNEYADDVFQNGGLGIRCGALYNGCSEVTVLRDSFSNMAGACVSVGNYNALDIWVRYSVFDHCGSGVSNNPGAGNFHVYNSIFRSSTVADIDIGNTTPFSFRDNYFTGSPVAIRGAGTGNPAPMTIESNTFIDQTQQAINMGNQGPVLLLDNSVRQTSSTLPAAYISIDGIAVGNTFTLGPTPIAAGQRLFEADTQIVAPSAINATEPVLPGVQPNMNRTVFEISVGANAAAIQSAINSAAALNGARPIVHLPEGQYSIGVPLSIPTNSDLQLVGDGAFSTALNWTGAIGTGPAILIAGPSHATLRDFRVNTNLQADAIGAYNIDQSGSRVFLHGVQMGADNLAANANLLYDGLDYAVVDVEDTGHASSAGTGVKVVGGPLAAAGTPAGGMVRFFSTSGGGETLPYSVSTGGTLLLRDDWSESQGPAFASITGRAQVTFDGVWANLNGNVGQSTPGVSISNLIGKVSILSAEPQDRTVLTGNGSQASVLQAGGSVNCPVVSPYLINNASPAGTTSLLNHRECTITVPGTGSIPTANFGSSDPTWIESMLAQTRAAHQVPLTTLPSGVTDLRLYRVSTSRGINGIHLANLRTSLH